MKLAIANQSASSALELLDLHYRSFHEVEHFATETGHPVPTDTRGWSQVLVSTLSGVKGLGRKKGPDLSDGSDVKAANTWEAIDTPRFNGVVKAGTLSNTSGRIESLDAMPHLYLVLWDKSPRETARCRVWVVRPKHDSLFREICQTWYQKLSTKEIKSNNFQLHPPRGEDSNQIRNTCGNLLYPLYFSAERSGTATYQLLEYNPQVRDSGMCRRVS